MGAEDNQIALGRGASVGKGEPATAPVGAAPVALLFIAGFGAYRAFKYGTGPRRLLGAVPIVLLVVACVIVPFVFGVTHLHGISAQRDGVDLLIQHGGELLIVAVGSFLLAAISGATLSLMFRPPKP